MAKKDSKVMFREIPCNNCRGNKVAVDPEGVHLDYCIDCGSVNP